jgi:hypothetical protein
MNGSKYIVNKNGERRDGCFGNAIRYGLGIPLILFLVWVLFSMVACKTVQVSEKVNVRDSVAIRWQDSTRWHVRDSVNIIEHHVTIKDSTGLTIQFGEGGGTYNAKTGEATNVAGVHQTDTHHEQRDSTAHYRNLASDYQHTADSLTNQLTTLQSEYDRAEKKARTGYDRFCSWWFWITAILLLAKIACWVLEKIPTTAPYILIARKFIPFL